MISEKFVEDCCKEHESVFGVAKEPEQMRAELERLQTAGCEVEKILKCSSCEKFGTGRCPLVIE